MSDELSADELAALLPEPVRNAYAEEQEFIDRRVAMINRVGETGVMEWVRRGTEWLPWVGEAFAETPKGPAAATSDINREVRFRAMVEKIEAGLGERLDDETRRNIRRDLYAMYNGDVADE